MTSSNSRQESVFPKMSNYSFWDNLTTRDSNGHSFDFIVGWQSWFSFFFFFYDIAYCLCCCEKRHVQVSHVCFIGCYGTRCFCGWAHIRLFETRTSPVLYCRSSVKLSTAAPCRWSSFNWRWTAIHFYIFLPIIPVHSFFLLCFVCLCISNVRCMWRISSPVDLNYEFLKFCSTARIS